MNEKVSPARSERKSVSSVEETESSARSERSLEIAHGGAWRPPPLAHENRSAARSTPRAVGATSPKEGVAWEPEAPLTACFERELSACWLMAGAGKRGRTVGLHHDRRCDPNQAADGGISPGRGSLPPVRRRKMD